MARSHRQVALALALAPSLFIACRDARHAPRDGPPDFSGSIVGVSTSPDTEGVLAVLRIDLAEPGPAFEPVDVAVTPASEVFVVDHGTRRRVDYHALRPGQHADVWSAEAAGETAPGERQGRRIVVRGGAGS